MKYIINQQTKIKRDWTVIILLYLTIVFMGTSFYYMVCNYVNSGKASICETRK